MQNYEGCNCPVCKKPLSSSDDIVVCPECGAPYHRACYEKQGACVYEHLHSSGFEWKRPSTAPKIHHCPSCGAEYTGDQLFCEKCGSPLHAEERRGGFSSAEGPLGGFGAGQPFGAGAAFAADTRGEIDGIPVSDWAAYIGPSAPYYIYQFRRMDATGHKVGFIFSAAFFAPIYFLYRKMWGIGILAGVINLLLNLPAALMMLAEFNIFFVLPVSYETLAVIASVCSLLLSAIQFVGWGMFAAWLYRRHCAKQIRRIREKTDGDPAAGAALLHKKGGPSKVVLIVLLVFYLLSTLLTAYLTGMLL
ncbi:MAG TPA: DUF2628 domain-containing protein [Candidatus Pygmaiobacter gallistercoris]|nr:DUF2628 domain-containing protein [Candidatus Pygmaiobacter gallistercoris]